VTRTQTQSNTSLRASRLLGGFVVLFLALDAVAKIFLMPVTETSSPVEVKKLIDLRPVFELVGLTQTKE
jgi:hypothetical protein